MDQSGNAESAMIYITNYIMPKGFTQEQFVAYLKTKRENGDNLNLWNMDELINIGNDFICEQQPEQYQYLLSRLIKFTPQSEIVMPIKDHNYDYPAPPKGSEILNSAPQQPSDLSLIGVQRYQVNKGPVMKPNPNLFLIKHPNLVASIIGTEFEKGSVFSRSFILYKVQLNPYGNILLKRYSDFDRLRDYLIKSYPEYIIAPIPKKVSSNKDPTVVGYRQQSLERFMNLVINGFWYDEYVNSFFAANEMDQAKNLKSLRLFDSRNTITLKGEIICQVSTQIDNFFNQTVLQLAKNGDIYEKIRVLNKKIIADNNVAAQNYKELAACYQTLANYTKMWNDGLPEKINDLQYRAASNLFTNWSAQIENINASFEKHIGNFAKYQNQIYETILDRIKFRELMKDEFLKSYAKIDAKKDKLFKEQNPNKWQIDAATLKQYPAAVLVQNEKIAKELMLPEETQISNYIQDNYGYVNNNLYQQAQFAQNYVLTQTQIELDVFIKTIQKIHTELSLSYQKQFSQEQRD